MNIDREQFNQISREFYPGLLGIEFTRIEDGVAECRMEVHQKLFNPGGMLHGGATYSLADTGMGLALWSLLDEGQNCATIEIKMTYIKAITSGTLHCITRVIDKRRRLAFLESEITDGADIVAKATGSFYIISE